MDDDGYLSKLRGVFTDEWREHAACIGAGDILFIDDNNPEGETVPMDEARAEPAKAICRVCPVRIECLDDALYMKDVDMIRGGYTYEEQQSIMRHRNRHLPALKEDVRLALGG